MQRDEMIGREDEKLESRLPNLEKYCLAEPYDKICGAQSLRMTANISVRGKGVGSRYRRGIKTNKKRVCK